ncbi:DnaA regulatory inactivator Hda [mine drainage metagenome]|uniref:DnaA regulatory inactivator Hda n=1 Tax=mine drainage metagenome TaxID=410659 RepID=A0A1J5QV64_9ZZZZ
MKQLLLDIQPAPAPTLENFVPGANTEALYSLLQAASGQADGRFIYLWGAPGSGKSHLLRACADLAREREVQLVIADDVQTLSGDAQIELFNTYNRLREGRGALIASGDAAPMMMGLRDDLATRLSWGLVYHLHPLSDEEKAQALLAHAMERGMKLPDGMVEYCLRHMRRDLRTLMATLDALDKWSLTAKRPVTLPLLRQLLQLPPD